MTRYFAPSALLPHGWAHAVAIEVDGAGSIVNVAEEADPAGRERLAGPVLPGMPNLHCHAFQRAMVGLTQRLQVGEASFWSWRETMFRFLERLDPDDVQAIAAQLYVEQLKGGYTSVVEFHYLHHAPDGQAYSDPATMSLAIDQAAEEAGIGLTLLPVIYMRGGFGDTPLEGGQRRFALDADQAFDLLDRLQGRFAGRMGRRLGLAPHSLRAVPGDVLTQVAGELHRRDRQAPIHIHVAEQVREVRECLDHHGSRPMRRLAQLVELSQAWTLIHATHLDDSESELLAGSGAVAGLCPTTEADLGDGVFQLAGHLALGGRIGIGSDSNVGVSAAGELRLLEYGQRLTTLRRLVAASVDQPSCGEFLWRAAVAGGAQAAARPIGKLAAGYRADFIVLAASDPDMRALPSDRSLDIGIFGPGATMVGDVIVGGVRVIRDGIHARQQEIADRYVRTVARRLS